MGSHQRRKGCTIRAGRCLAAWARGGGEGGGRTAGNIGAMGAWVGAEGCGCQCDVGSAVNARLGGRCVKHSMGVLWPSLQALEECVRWKFSGVRSPGGRDKRTWARQEAAKRLACSGKISAAWGLHVTKPEKREKRGRSAMPAC